MQRSDETDALATALARIHCADLVSPGQPRERRTARAMLLRDYHPDKTGGSAEWNAAINYVHPILLRGGKVKTPRPYYSAGAHAVRRHLCRMDANSVRNYEAMCRKAFESP